MESLPAEKLANVESLLAEKPCRGGTLAGVETLPRRNSCRGRNPAELGRNLAGVKKPCWGETLSVWKAYPGGRPASGGYDSQADEKLKMGSQGYLDNLGWKSVVHESCASRQSDRF